MRKLTDSTSGSSGGGASSGGASNGGACCISTSWSYVASSSGGEAEILASSQAPVLADELEAGVVMEDVVLTMVV